MRYFTRTIHEPAGATTDRGVNRILFSWQPELGMKNYRLQVSARPDFARLVENVITDNTVYAPRLSTAQAYLSGGLFYWRVAAGDEDRNTGDFSQALTLSLPKAMRVTTSGSPVKGRQVPITVTVRDAARKPVRRAAVRVSGAGARAVTRRTNAEGRVVFYVKGDPHRTRHRAHHEERLCDIDVPPGRPPLEQAGATLAGRPRSSVD
jgi:hypothetical protein